MGESLVGRYLYLKKKVLHRRVSRLRGHKVAGIYTSWAVSDRCWAWLEPWLSFAVGGMLTEARQNESLLPSSYQPFSNASFWQNPNGSWASRNSGTSSV